MGGGEDVVGTVAENGAQLDAALELAEHAKSLTLIEVRLTEMDGSQALIRLCSNCNRFNLGVTPPRRS